MAPIPFQTARREVGRDARSGMNVHRTLWWHDRQDKF
jgi:hypothetical protein